MNAEILSLHLKHIMELRKIAFGGGCSWCTEAVFQSLIGVGLVEQGYVASFDEAHSFSEAVIVHFKPADIPLQTLIKIHLYTHRSTNGHSMCGKYRSATYTFSELQMIEAVRTIRDLQPEFDHKIITKVLLFRKFKLSLEQITNYYYSNSKKPFCKNFITPKLQLLHKEFPTHTDTDKLNLTFIEL